MKRFKKKLLFISSSALIFLIMFAGMCFLIVGKRGVVEFVDKNLNKETSYENGVSKGVTTYGEAVSVTSNSNEIEKQQTNIVSTDELKDESENATEKANKTINPTDISSETEENLQKKDESKEPIATNSNSSETQTSTIESVKSEEVDSESVTTSNLKSSITQIYTITSSNGTIDVGKVKIVYKANFLYGTDYELWCDNAAIQYSVEPWYVALTEHVKGKFTEDGLVITINSSNALAQEEGKTVIYVRFIKSDMSNFEELEEESLEVYYDGKKVN